MKGMNNVKKNAVRDVALYRDGKKLPAKSALMLPGVDAIDVKQALEEGSINEQTKFIAIEKNPDNFGPVRRNLKKLGFQDVLFHTGEASELGRSRILAFLGKKNRIEFNFLDFCGQFTLGLAHWISGECADLFKVGSDVSFTFSLQHRNKSNIVLKSMDERLFYCADTCNADEECEPKFYNTYDQDRISTITGLWASLAVNYHVKFTHIRGYTGFDGRTPMIMLKLHIESNKSSLDVRHLNRIMNGDILLEPCKIPDSSPAWKRLGCHPAMSASTKTRFVKQSKQGQRPPWMNKQTWAWHSLNPNGMANRRAA